jgi:hypothetical protein
MKQKNMPLEIDHGTFSLKIKKKSSKKAYQRYLRDE